jgi:hypothetical protein
VSPGSGTARRAGGDETAHEEEEQEKEEGQDLGRIHPVSEAKQKIAKWQGTEADTYSYLSTFL